MSKMYKAHTKKEDYDNNHDVILSLSILIENWIVREQTSVELPEQSGEIVYL